MPLTDYTRQHSNRYTHYANPRVSSIANPRTCVSEWRWLVPLHPRIGSRREVGGRHTTTHTHHHALKSWSYGAPPSPQGVGTGLFFYVAGIAGRGGGHLLVRAGIGCVLAAPSSTLPTLVHCRLIEMVVPGAVIAGHHGFSPASALKQFADDACGRTSA